MVWFNCPENTRTGLHFWELYGNMVSEWWSCIMFEWFSWKISLELHNKNVVRIVFLVISVGVQSWIFKPWFPHCHCGSRFPTKQWLEWGKQRGKNDSSKLIFEVTRGFNQSSEGKPGGFPSRRASLFGKALDCVPDPFGNVFLVADF